jgi:uridine kinase
MRVIEKRKSLLDHVSRCYHERKQSTGSNHFLLLIGGCSRSGKTTITKTISKHLSLFNIPTLRVPLDSWLLGIESRTPEMGVLDRYQCRQIVQAIKVILDGRKVYPPVYDVISRRRISERSSEYLHIKEGVVIVDGVPALAIPALRHTAALRIFVDLDDTDRKRRLRKFYLHEKSLSEHECAEIISRREQEEVLFIKHSKKFADIVFLNSDELVSGG